MRLVWRLAVAAVVLVAGLVVRDLVGPDEEVPSQRTGSRVERWETVVDEAAGFSVDLPAPAMRGSGGATVGPGVQVVVHERRAGGMSLQWFDYLESDPPAPDPVAEVERRAVALFQGTTQSMVTVSAQPAQVGGRPGATVRITKGSVLVRGWGVVEGGQFFLLTAAVDRDWRPADEERMVRSFRLLPSP